MLRKIVVRANEDSLFDTPAYFHKWFTDSGNEPVAIIEEELGGQVKTVYAWNVKFIDTPPPVTIEIKEQDG